VRNNKEYSQNEPFYKVKDNSQEENSELEEEKVLELIEDEI